MSPRKKIRYLDQDLMKKINLFYRNIRLKEDLNPINITLEEYEALRLYHYEKLPQEKCKDELNVSQPTFSRILKSGMEKLVQALVEEKNFQIAGGNIRYKEWLGWGCYDCLEEWGADEDLAECPKCGSKQIFKLKKTVRNWSS